MDVIERARTAAAQFAARADEADRLGRLPLEDVRALFDSGLLRLSIPQMYGGEGAPLADCAAVILELAQGSPSTALVAAMHLHVFGAAAENRPWPEAIFARLCAEGLDGALFNTVASEPLLGSPSRGGAFATRAIPCPEGGWRVSGHKTWITGGRHLTHLLVRATLDDQPALLLVRGGADGLLWDETWRDALSLRASDSHDLHLHEVYVPPDDLIDCGAPAEKPPEAWFPLLVTCVYLGAALAARDAVIRYALERVPTALGKPIATLPRIQRQIGEIDVALQAAQTLLLAAARDWRGSADQRRALLPRLTAAKYLAAETAAAVTDKAMRIAGGASIGGGLPLARYFRDTRAGLMHPPAGDTALEIVGAGAVEAFRQAHHD